MPDSLHISGREYSFDASRPIDISIPLQFEGPQPNAYGVPPASAEACVSGELVGDTRRGGSCNFEQYTLIPHCNGTHTECVGHITNERISVRDCLIDVLVPAFVVTITPSAPEGETYSMAIGEFDQVITRSLLANHLPKPVNALVIRTLPNDDEKLSAAYVENIPPYFTTEAMEFLVEVGIKHLVVDLPSIDRLYDEGRLSNHRVFWNVEPGSFDMNELTRRDATITELAYIPNDVGDGTYLLNLQIAPFASDASPARPILFRASEN